MRGNSGDTIRCAGGAVLAGVARRAGDRRHADARRHVPASFRLRLAMDTGMVVDATCARR